MILEEIESFYGENACLLSRKEKARMTSSEMRKKLRRGEWWQTRIIKVLSNEEIYILPR